MNVTTCVGRALKPYPGLRPFRSDEADIFFGREEQIDQLLLKLEQTRFLSIIGESGCGKSSLVHAGLLPALTSGFLPTAGPAWRVVHLRPGNRPLRSLAAALLAHQLLPAQEDLGEHAAVFVEAQLRRGPRSVTELLAGADIEKDANILLFVDQFEEIFRFREPVASNDADAFVALLLGATSQDPRMHIVLTMRSDFLGDCALFPGLPERLNDSQFLTPRLTRGQRREAIEQPAYVFGGRVEPALTARLLNDMGSGPDRLPLMQHALLQLWNKAVAARGEPSTSDEEIRLTLADYEQLGGLALALSHHADSVYHNLPPERQPVAETLFRALCQGGEGKRDLRRPERLGQVARIADVPVPVVAQVVEKFRGADCNFLMPPPPIPLGPETMLDISHESLIRQWQRLQQWCEAESRSAGEYQFLELTARKWQSGQGSPLGQRTVQRLLHWRQTEKPNAAWAKRYGDDFELAMRFLDHCVEDQRRNRRNALLLLGLIVLLTAALAALIISNHIEHARTDEVKRESAENQGTLALEQGDVAGALFRFADPERADENVRRLRQAIGIRQLPRLIDCWTIAGQKTLGVAFDPGSDRLLLFGSSDAEQPVGFLKLLDMEKKSEDEAAREIELGVEPVSHAAFLDKKGTALSVSHPEGKTCVFRVWHMDADGRLAVSKPSLPAGSSGAVLAVHPSEPEAVCMVQSGTGKSQTTRVFLVRVDPDRAAQSHEIAKGSGPGAAASYSADGRGLLVSVKDADGSSRVIVHRIAEPAPGNAKVAKGGFAERYRALDPLPPLSNVNHASLSPGTQLVATCHGDQLSERGEIAIWRHDGAKWLSSPLTHLGGVSYAEFSPDGRKLVSACHDGYARIWTLTPHDKQSPGVLTYELKHGGSVMTARLSPDGLLLATGSRDRRVRVWSTRTGTLAMPVLNFGETVGAVQFDPSGFKLAAVGQTHVQVWELFTVNPASRTLLWRGNVQDVSTSADGRFVALAGAGKVQLWIHEQGQGKGQGQGLGKGKGKGRGQGKQTKKAGELRELWNEHPPKDGWDQALTAAVHPLQGGVVAVVQQKSTAPQETRLAIWQGDQLTPVPGATEGLLVSAVAWSPDGLKLALVGLEAKSRKAEPPQGFGRVLRFQEREGETWWEGADIVPLEARHKESILSAQFDADSRLLATSGVDDRALVWDLSARRGDNALKSKDGDFAHSADVVQAAFSPDQRYLATASLDGTCKVWDLSATTAAPLVLEHNAAVTAVRWLPVPEAPDRLFVASACRDGIVRVWHVKPAEKMAAHQRHLVAVFPTEGYIRDLIYVPDANRPDAQRRLVACSTLSLARRTGMAPDKSKQVFVRLQVRYQGDPKDLVAFMDESPPKDEPVLVTRHVWRVEPDVVPGEHVVFLANPRDGLHWPAIRAAYHKRYDVKELSHHHVRLAAETEQQGEWHAAGWHLDRLLDQTGEDVGLLKRRASVYLNSAAPDAALRHLADAFELAPNDADVAELQGKAYADLKRWPEAVLAVERSGVAAFWRRPEYTFDLEPILAALYDAKLHEKALALIGHWRSKFIGRDGYFLIEMAKNRGALDDWEAVRELVLGYFARSAAPREDLGAMLGIDWIRDGESSVLLRHGALAAFHLGDRQFFSQCTSELDTRAGGDRLSQPERRLVAVATLFADKDKTGMHYLRYCRRMFEQFDRLSVAGPTSVIQSKPAPLAPPSDPLPSVAAAAAWTCVLGPLPAPGTKTGDAGDPDVILAEAARLATQARDAGLGKEFASVQGAVQLRQAMRQKAGAARESAVQKALATFDQGGMPGFDDLFRTLGHADLGEAAQARAAWKRAEEYRRQFGPRGPDPARLGRFVDYLEFETLRREVESALKNLDR